MEVEADGQSEQRLWTPKRAGTLYIVKSVGLDVINLTY